MLGETPAISNGPTRPFQMTTMTMKYQNIVSENSEHETSMISSLFVKTSSVESRKLSLPSKCSFYVSGIEMEDLSVSVLFLPELLTSPLSPSPPQLQRNICQCLVQISKCRQTLSP